VIVYPSTNKGNINVLSKVSGTLTLCDLQGEEQFHGEIKESTELCIPKNLSKGTYMVTLITKKTWSNVQ
jgi:hypothetical protein